MVRAAFFVAFGSRSSSIFGEPLLRDQAIRAMVRNTGAMHEVIEAAVASCIEQILENTSFTECCKEYIEETSCLSQGFL